MYADEIATWFDADGPHHGPGRRRIAVSLTYRPELAEAIAELLVDEPHTTRDPCRPITGPEAVSAHGARGCRTPRSTGDGVPLRAGSDREEL
jgi:hypothetical protein